jgi:hypothetical protein
MFKIQKKILHAEYIAFMCFVRISEQTATFALYCINWLVFITVVESVYSAARTEYITQIRFIYKGLNFTTTDFNPLKASGYSIYHRV